MCIFHYFNHYLPDFVNAISLGFIFGFSFWGMCLNLTQYHNKLPVGSSFLMRDQALSLWSGSTDSKTLDYQRTNPRRYQILRTHTNETTGIQDPASPNHQQHPVQDASYKQPTKQIQTQSSADKITTSLSLVHQRKINQTKKSSAQISPYMKLTQTTGPTSGLCAQAGKCSSQEARQASLLQGKRGLTAPGRSGCKSV